MRMPVRDALDSVKVDLSLGEFCQIGSVRPRGSSLKAID